MVAAAAAARVSKVWYLLYLFVFAFFFLVNSDGFSGQWIWVTRKAVQCL